MTTEHLSVAPLAAVGSTLPAIPSRFGSVMLNTVRWLVERYGHDIHRIIRASQGQRHPIHVLILKAVCCSLVFSEDATFSPYWLVRNLESDLVAKLAKLPVLCQHLQQHGEATQTDLTLVPCPVLRQTL